RLLTWQVTHHAAVNSTNTGWPAATSCVTRAAEYSLHGPSAAERLATFDSASNAEVATIGPPTASAPAMLAAAARPQPRAPPVRIVCHAQSPSAISSSVIPSRNTASLSNCAPSTQASQSTVAYSGNASKCLSRSIHAPGFGSLLRQAGK